MADEFFKGERRPGRATATFCGNLYIRYPSLVLHAGSCELADGAT